MNEVREEDSQSNSSFIELSNSSFSPHFHNHSTFNIKPNNSLSDHCQEITEKFPNFNIGVMPHNKSRMINEPNHFGDISVSFKNINDILDEYSLKNIFSFLTVVERLQIQTTCQKWYSIIGELHQSQVAIGMSMSCANCPTKIHQISSHECVGAYFQSTIENSSDVYFISAIQLEQILSKCINLKSLVMQNCIFSRECVDIFTIYCSSNLQHLDLSNSSCVINEIIKNVSEKCKTSLKHVILKENIITENALKCLIENCVNLELLILDKNEEITGECFESLSCKIKMISFLECPNVGVTGINSLVNGNGVNITQIKIGGNITTEMLNIICQNMINLQTFELVGFNTDDVSNYNCIQELTQLTELILKLPRFAFDNPLIQIVRKCKFLKKIQVDGAIISNRSIIQISVSCPQLEHLSIAPNHNFINELITNECCNALATIKNLRFLSLCNSNVGDAIITAILSCIKLNWIKLEGCKNITTNVLNACVEKAQMNQQIKIVLYVQKTQISQSNLSMPSNLSVFSSMN